MGRAPCCDKANVKKGPWSPEEDTKLKEYIDNFGTGGNWIALPHKAGLRRCGKSCRLRWLNYLRPDIKHGQFSDEEDRIICSLFATIGSRWSIIAAQLPGRTDNDIKNYWNTKLKKKFMEIFPSSQTKSLPPIFSSFQNAPTYQSNISYHPLSKSLYGLEPPSSIPSNLFNTSITSNLFEHQESLIGFKHHYDHQERDNLLVFGTITGEPSCSSSDGSTNQISANSVQIGQEGYVTNGGHQDQKFMLGSSTCVGWSGRTNDFLLETPLPLDYNNSCSTSDQEIRTQSRVVYF